MFISQPRVRAEGRCETTDTRQGQQSAVAPRQGVEQGAPEDSRRGRIAKVIKS